MSFHQNLLRLTIKFFWIKRLPLSGLNPISVYYLKRVPANFWRCDLTKLLGVNLGHRQKYQ